MGKASRNKRDSARERIAAQRAAQRKAEIRNRMFITGGSILGVIAIVVGFVIFKTTQSPASANNASPTSATGTALPASVIKDITGVPASTLASVGTGTADPKSVSLVSSAKPLTSAGKPELLYIGAEYCPYCATERWPMIVALSRFGTFSRLGATHSSPSDVYPNTSTFSFHGATYTSPYLSLDAKELQSNQVSNGQYTTLDKLNSAEKSNFHAGGSGYPYINLAGSYRVSLQLNPQVLQGKTIEQVAAALSDPNSAIAKAVALPRIASSRSSSRQRQGRPARSTD